MYKIIMLSQLTWMDDESMGKEIEIDSLLSQLFKNN